MPKNRSEESRLCESLQALYLQCINSILDDISSTGFKDKDQYDKIIQLLKLYDPDPYWNYLHIRQLFHRLITLAKNGQSDISIETVIEALMGRNIGYLLEEFCKVLHELHLLDINQHKDLRLGPLTEEQKFTVRLLTGSDRENCWQHYFLACLKWNKHFLGHLMVCMYMCVLYSI